uniref:Minor tegument protein n=1 Tax=Chimpanzee herpesvirus strain 105640 TaxID=332937 RepID=Q3C201_9ALPH|nr:minor tegument protein [Chimpanzee herpesvirus strain 105640]
MNRDASHTALRRRLAETHLRAEVYRDQTLQLHREGVSTQDPRFVGAFMAAKAAHLELEARLKSRARLEMMRQRATCVKIRVEEQAARRISNRTRRYLDPALSERLDAVDDRLVDQEEQLEEAAANASLWGDGDLADGWMSPGDSDLLVMWQLTSAPKVHTDAPSRPGSRPTYTPSVAGHPDARAAPPPETASSPGPAPGPAADPAFGSGFVRDYPDGE